MLTRDEAIWSAARSAQAAWGGIGRCGGVWQQKLGRGVDAYADFLDHHGDATAAALYDFAQQDRSSVAAWPRVDRELRVALEVFRASYRALMVLVHEGSRSQETKSPAQPASAQQQTESARPAPSASSSGRRRGRFIRPT